MTALVPISRRPKAPFLDGMARLIDISGVQRKSKRFDTANEADMYALQTDWAALIGDWFVLRRDISSAGSHFVGQMEKMMKELPSEGSDR
jgi:hypothetical protein